MKKNIMLLTILVAICSGQVFGALPLVNLLSVQVVPSRWDDTAIPNLSENMTDDQTIAIILSYYVADLYLVLRSDLTEKQRYWCAAGIVGDGVEFRKYLTKAADRCSYFSDTNGPTLTADQERYYYLVYAMIKSSSWLKSSYPWCAARHFIKGDY